MSFMHVADMAERLRLGYQAAVMREGRMETFEYHVDGEAEAIWMNVTLARVLVEQGYASVPVPVAPAELAAIATRNEWDAETVARADTTVPGIAMPIVLAPPLVPTPTVIYILIDGTHRAVRAHQDGTAFSAYLLRDAAAQLCVLSGPAHLFPWGYRQPGHES